MHYFLNVSTEVRSPIFGILATFTTNLQKHTALLESIFICMRRPTCIVTVVLLLPSDSLSGSWSTKLIFRSLCRAEMHINHNIDDNVILCALYRPLIPHMQPAPVQCMAVNAVYGTVSFKLLKPGKQYKFQSQQQWTVKIY